MTSLQEKMDHRTWYEFGGLLIHVFSDTGMPFSMAELTGLQGCFAPFHIHQKNVEMFVGIDGEFTMYVGDDEYTIRAGDRIMLPKGISHRFQITGAFARWYGLYWEEKGYPHLFEEIGKPVTSLLLPTPYAPDVELLKTHSAKYGVIYL